MKNILIVLLTIASSLSCFGQNDKPTFQSNYSLDFKLFLSGVKYAEVFTTPEQEQAMLNNPGSADVYLGVTSYLEAMRFEIVGLSAKFRDFIPESFCDMTNVIVNYSVNGSYINDFSVTFYDCIGDSWTFKSSEVMKMNQYESVHDMTYNALQKLYGFAKTNYEPYFRMKLKSEATSWTEAKLKSHFQSNGADEIEGIYENTDNSNKMAKYKVCVVKNNDGYDMIYLSGAKNYLDWNEGDIKAKLSSTATNTMFKADWYTANKTKNSDFYISFEPGLMNVITYDKSKKLYLKLYPSSLDKVPSSNNNSHGSGTGFAISPKGYIATNSHVISGANVISVKGINGNYDKSYKAKLIIEDKKNDLAVI